MIKQKIKSIKEIIKDFKFILYQGKVFKDIARHIRITTMTAQRYDELTFDTDAQLTEQEIKDGWVFCTKNKLGFFISPVNKNFCLAYQNNCEECNTIKNEMIPQNCRYTNVNIEK